MSLAKDSLIFRARVALNRRIVDVSCLIDTGVDGYIFLDYNLIITITKGLGLRTIRLPREYPITRFNSSLAELILYTVKLILIIDGYI